MIARLDGESGYCDRNRPDKLAGGRSAIEPKVECHLVVSRPARMQRRPRRGDLSQPSLDRRVDVLIGVQELQRAGIDLAFHPSKPALDGGELGRGQEPGGRQAARVRDAPCDVEGVQLVIGIERRRKALELR
jgi:hypothetical protein